MQEPLQELHRQVSRARQRLAIARFVDALGGCCTATLTAALVATLAAKFWPLDLDPWVWPAAGLALGLLAAAARTALSGQGALGAAVEIDRRFGLQERVSSALILAPARRASPVGQAVVADAVAHVRGLDVGARFPLQPRRRLLLPLAPAAGLALVLLLAPSRSGPPAPVATAAAEQVAQVRQVAEPLCNKLAQQRALAAQQDFTAAERLFQKLEQGARELTVGPADRKEAQIKFQQLAELLQQRRGELAGADEMRQVLRQFKAVENGPADPFARAVGQGDLAQAVSALERLQTAFESGQLNAQQRRQLVQQLGQMQERLQETVQAHRDAQQKLTAELRRLQETGPQAEADQVQQRLERLADRAPQVRQMEDLAQGLSACSKGISGNDVKHMQRALGAVQNQLRDLQRQRDELPLLDQAQSQLRQAQDQLNCQACGGTGCDTCQSVDPRPSQIGSGAGAQPGNLADAPAAPREQHQTYDSRVPQRVNPGAAMAVGRESGPNAKGRVQEEIRAQTAAVRRGQTDPLGELKLSREQRDHAREYFDRFRKEE